jgi:BirA family transcriptional regulator, biotin operon repressor / biotin---[acetyl-CoA-carboxylase] ligase
MREQLIQMLIQNMDAYVSGEDLSKVYGVTRAAIWKHIQALKEQGCDIVCTPHKGYKLRAMPDSMRPEFLMAWLSTRYIGKDMRYYDRIDSTNTKARELAASGCPKGMLVLADEQTSGKGRLGRRWHSPPGTGIYASFVIRPDLHPSQAPQITAVAALAVLRALKTMTGMDAKIKWPNDIVAGDRKLAGIMTEMSADMDRINWIVAGIGINVNNAEFPPEIAMQSTSVRLLTGNTFSRVQVLLTMCHELEDLLNQLENDFRPILEEYAGSSAVMDKPVVIQLHDTKINGIVKGFDTDGALILETEDGQRKRIVSGEVSLRGMNGYV